MSHQLIFCSVMLLDVYSIKYQKQGFRQWFSLPLREQKKTRIQPKCDKQQQEQKQEKLLALKLKAATELLDLLETIAYCWTGPIPQQTIFGIWAGTQQQYLPLLSQYSQCSYTRIIINPVCLEFGTVPTVLSTEPIAVITTKIRLHF